MSPIDVTEISRQALYIMMLVSGPLMFLALLVGVAIALVQALTQIQEMTLTFVPKLFVLFIAILILSPFMYGLLSDFMDEIYNNIGLPPI
ncbi:MAG: flagellar biosynthetic protein FliQ [Pseudomonadota bacterium]